MAFVNGDYEAFVSSTADLETSRLNSGFVMCCANGLADRVTYLLGRNVIDREHARYGLAYARVNRHRGVMEALETVYPGLGAELPTRETAEEVADEFWETISADQKVVHSTPA